MRGTTDNDAAAALAENVNATLPHTNPNLCLPGKSMTAGEMLRAEQGSPWRKKAQMAEYYDCDLKTISNLMRRRILPFVKIGRFVRFNLPECDRAMERYKRKSHLLEDEGAGCEL
jgi:hypothetical protein